MSVRQVAQLRKRAIVIYLLATSLKGVSSMKLNKELVITPKPTRRKLYKQSELTEIQLLMKLKKSR